MVYCSILPVGTTHEHNLDPLNPLDLSGEELDRVSQPHNHFACGKKIRHCSSKKKIHYSYPSISLSLQARRQTSGGRRIIEITMISDRNQYSHYQNNIQNTVSRALALANVADRIYQQVNIRIVVVYSIVWTTGDRSQFSSSPDVTLQNFRTHTLSIRSQYPSDATMLIT